MTYIGRDTVRLYVINKVVPSIIEKWPNDDYNTTLFIQLDNARTHINPNDEEFRLAMLRLGVNIQLFNHPSNSPNMNVLDLGFFNAI